ncbi:glycoside hydrolase family 113 [Sabulicella glaciei]|uniref:Ig-like domain-containing protein n=1 Tax=Sabulicella glaciei TaxID=2984948 RepID=A0ABT3P107_9PROT|nr:Ig-like domain-containing protein [Roseococcus sp. MDT2-1-1]MCW8088099.1 Ig-like domain-containing protein [Roseococcus sp. MDT2-1-1]
MSSGLFEYAGFAFPSWWNGSFGSATSLTSLTALASTGSNSVSIVPTSYISTVTSSDFHASSQTESDANVRAQILQAHSLGLDVILKPHVDAEDGSAFRGEFAPSDVDAWFAGYKALILRYAKIAAETGVKTLSIGCEYDSLVGAAYRSRWVDIIDSVRAVYDGVLTYAATAMSARNVSFWDQVDLIGVNSYYRMSESTTASVQDYKNSWTSVPTNAWEFSITEGKSPIDFLRNLAVKYDKPLFLAEVGYRSMDGAALDPGIWTSSGAVDLQEQANLYQALFETFTTYGGDWFAGMHLWNWDITSKGASNTNYSPQDKPALQVVTNWFTGQTAIQGLSLNGSIVADALHGGLGADMLNAGMGNDTLFGGGGDDILIGGPSTLASAAPLASTTLVVSARADVLNGVGAKFVILVNGAQIGGTFEAKAQAGQFSVTFANTATVNSVGVKFVNDEMVQGVGDRNLYVLGLEVNGKSLPISEAVNPTGNGQGSMWFNSTLSIDTRSRQDWFTGATTDHDTLFGGAGDDTLIGGVGNDYLDGGEGNDVALYSGFRSEYAVSSLSGGFFQVTDLRTGSPEGTDRLKDVEFLRFADGTFSLPQLAGGGSNPVPVVTPKILAFSSDTGASASDRITSDNTLVFLGSTEAGRGVQILLNNQVIGTTTADASGQWSFDHSGKVLADGQHVLTAIDLDAAGVAGGASGGFAFTVDTRAPDAPVIARITPDTGTSAADGVTNSKVVTLLGTAEAGASLAVHLGTALIGQATADAEGRWSFTTSSLVDGVHRFTAQATDLAGNKGALSSVAQVTVDTVAPVARFTGLEAGKNAATLEGVAEAGSTVQVFGAADKLMGTTTASANGQWSLAVGSLGNGAQTFRISAADAAGNAGAGEGLLLFGSSKADTLLGTTGRDLLVGGAGHDVLTGGQGSDVFLFASGFGRDRITDFTAGAGAGRDQIQFDQTLFKDFSAVLARTTQMGADSVITLDSSNSVTLVGVSKTALVSDNFLFV